MLRICNDSRQGRDLGVAVSRQDRQGTAGQCLAQVHLRKAIADLYLN